jgi:hypothetical protein
MTPRLAIQLGLAGLSALLFLLTILWHDWIEAVFGVEPDQGSGALELGIVAVMALAAVIFGLRARAQWSRMRAGERSGPAE